MKPRNTRRPRILDVFFVEPVSKRRMTRLALACSVLIVSACAARGPSPQVLAELGKADALLRQGCYTCLKEADAIYTRLSAVPKPLPAARQGAFDAAMLIAIRERELGMFPTGHGSRSTAGASARRRLCRRRCRLGLALRCCSTPPSSSSAKPAAWIPNSAPSSPAVRGRRWILPTRHDARLMPRLRPTSWPTISRSRSIASRPPSARVDRSGRDPRPRRGGIPLMRFRLAMCPQCRRAETPQLDSRSGPALARHAAVGRRGSARARIADARHRSAPQVVALLTPGSRSVPGVVSHHDAVGRQQSVAGGVRGGAFRIRHGGGCVADPPRRDARPADEPQLPDAARRCDCGGHAADRPRHVAHRRRVLLARVESLQPQELRTGLAGRREGA